MSRFWSERVAGLEPYKPGEQPQVVGMVKLNTNENPYGPSPQVRAALKGHLTDELRLYPDPESARLRDALAQRFSLNRQQVFVGNGSDEVLAHVFHGLFQHKLPVLFPDITYSFYTTYARLYDVSYRMIPLDDAFALNIEDYRQPNGGILIANPNAPTGRFLDLAALTTLLQFNTDSVVVVDEAYIDFGGQSAATLLADYPNLLVVQTFSKSWSLAGMRVGFALGQEPLIEALNRIKNSFNSYPLDRLAQLAAEAALQDEAWFSTTTQAIIASREQLAQGLDALGFSVLPSAANFVMASHRRPASELSAALRERHIFVRHFAGGRIDNWLRITVGLPEENHRLLQALREILVP
ncbi:MAG: histidinol-phosphate transaminase [Pseudomonadales bacterium]|nr:histidinol-phosphate transaminase [Pseudomonadales bacterium]